jgi:hypothetical protein
MIMTSLWTRPLSCKRTGQCLSATSTGQRISYGLCQGRRHFELFDHVAALALDRSAIKISRDSEEKEGPVTWQLTHLANQASPKLPDPSLRTFLYRLEFMANNFEHRSDYRHEAVEIVQVPFTTVDKYFLKNFNFQDCWR